MDSKPPTRTPAAVKKLTVQATVKKLTVQATSVVASSAVSPCGACKFLRRKCVAGCMFAPHFRSDQGTVRFAAVHKVFGASNVSKLLQQVPPGRRGDAVVTICYEAHARMSDPVYGCVSTIVALQQQVASLQTELSIVQSQLINSKLAVAGTLQPAYSNSSAASSNMANPSGFPSAGSVDVSDIVLSSRGLEPLQLLQSLYDEEEEENQDPSVFANSVFHPN